MNIVIPFCVVPVLRNYHPNLKERKMSFHRHCHGSLQFLSNIEPGDFFLWKGLLHIKLANPKENNATRMHDGVGVYVHKNSQITLIDLKLDWDILPS